MEDLVYWLALQERHWLLPAEKVAQAFYEYGTLEKLWAASNSDLLRLGLSDHTISAFFKYKNKVRLQDFEKQLEDFRRLGVRLIRYTDKEYPSRLKDLTKTMEGPPLLIFHRGALLDFSNAVAIVGTRVCSHYGHMMARRLSRDLAKKGYTIVSGLARGVDTEAHCGALEAPHGKTVAVLAWMGSIYPPENVELTKDIEKRGAILSERYQKPFNKFSKFAPGKFVERNRITSGISRCVIAIESDEKGGTVHQVDLAISQGRTVFALKPQSSNERAMRGYKLFLSQGAISIKSSKEVLRFLEREKTERTPKERKLDSFSQYSLTSFQRGE